MRKQLSGIVVSLVLLCGASAAEKFFDAKTGVQWSLFEWAIENPTCSGNPFDVRGEAVFAHLPTGRTITTRLFYDENDQWKFRFTGTEAGEWRFRTYSEDGDLDGWSGRVVVSKNSDPDARGFMKAINGKWGWQGSETVFIPQYVMGKHPRVFLDARGGLDVAAIHAYIHEYVEEHGFTGFHFAMEGRWFDGENPDPRVYRAVETIIREVHARGGATHLWFWGCDPCADGSGPGNLAGGHMSAMDQRNLNYFAARMGPIPGWSMGYGFDLENGWMRPEALDEWKAFLKSRMGYNHFLGGRVGYDHVGLTRVDPRPPIPPVDAYSRSFISDQHMSWLGGDYMGYTSYAPLYPRYLQAVQHHPEKPSFEEDRFRVRQRKTWSFKDYTPELTRRGMWHSAMAGGVANIWGNLLPHNINTLGSEPYDNREILDFEGTELIVDMKEQIKTYSRFFERRFLPEMVTFYDGPEMRLIVARGRHAVIYREDTDIVRLNLQLLRGEQPVIAVDTQKPYREIQIGGFAPGRHTWEAPYRSDWAIAVGDFSKK
jgi:hypothetical protein